MNDEDLRIVSLLPAATEIVCALGLQDALVGITHECDYPHSVKSKPCLTSTGIESSASSMEIDHAVRSQLDGHGSIYELDERALNLQDPNLVLTQDLCEVCAVHYDQVQKAIRIQEEGDVRIASLEPKTIAEIFDTVRTIGGLTARTEVATTIVEELSGRIQRIEASLSRLDRRPRVLMLEWLDPLFAPGHWVPEQVAIAGGELGFGTAGKPSFVITQEQVVEYGPEVIILIPCGFYKEDIIREWSKTGLAGLRGLPAFDAGEVWATDASAYFSRPGPRIVDGIEILTRILHPEIFGAPTDTEAVRVPVPKDKPSG